MDILTVLDRIKALQEFEVKTTLPEDFRFNGRVPFDMQIVGDEVTIKVLALTLEEAMMRVDLFLFGVDDESN
jgi:hypothetical protein